MRKSSLISTFAVLLVALALISPVLAQTGSVSKDKQEKIILLKGGSWGPAELSAYDIGASWSGTIIAIGVGTVTIEVRDCCIQGDTMFISASAKLLGFPKTAYAEGTSDAPGSPWSWEEATTTALVTIHVIGISIINVDVGYTECLGGFPAGYWVCITFT